MIRFKTTKGHKVHAAERFDFSDWGKPGGRRFGTLTSLCMTVKNWKPESNTQWDHHSFLTCKECQRRIQNRIDKLNKMLPHPKF